MSTVTRLCIALLAVLALPVQATPADPPGEVPAEVLATARSFFDAFNAHDADALMAHYALGAVVVWPTSTMIYDGSEAQLEGGRQWHQYAAALRIETDFSHATMVDAVTAVLLVEGTMYEDDERQGDLYGTLVLHRTADGWKIVAEHSHMRPETDPSANG